MCKVNYNYSLLLTIQIISYDDRSSFNLINNTNISKDIPKFK